MWLAFCLKYLFVLRASLILCTPWLPTRMGLGPHIFYIFE